MYVTGSKKTYVNPAMSAARCNYSGHAASCCCEISLKQGTLAELSRERIVNTVSMEKRRGWLSVVVVFRGLRCNVVVYHPLLPYSGSRNVLNYTSERETASAIVQLIVDILNYYYYYYMRWFIPIYLSGRSNAWMHPKLLVLCWFRLVIHAYVRATSRECSQAGKPKENDEILVCITG